MAAVQLVGGGGLVRVLGVLGNFPYSVSVGCSAFVL